MNIIGARSLLNLPGMHSVASIVGEVDLADEYLTTVCSISDCSRVIHLEFAYGTNDDRENNLYKIDTMIDVLRQFRKGVVRANAIGKRKEEK